MKIETAVAAAGPAEQAAQGRMVGVFLDALRQARRSVRARGQAAWRPEDLLERRLARNATIWAALQRLGVQEGSEIRLDFFFETAGRAADRELAEFLRREWGHQVVVEADGISGRTRPMVVSASALDDWARAMLHVGFEHGGCLFAGWTATVSR